MNSNLEQKMTQVYEAMVHVALYNHPLSEIESHITDDFMGYGTALDETVRGWKDFKWMIERQRGELDSEVEIKRIPLLKQTYSNDRSALIVEEFEMTMNMGEEIHGFTLRLSTLLEFTSDKWVIKHFHGSTADADTPEGNAWPIEEWKRRNAELQRVVAEKTHDLQEKNRELEIEAALERVRAKSMAMHKSEDLADLSLELVQQVQNLGIETWFCAFNINDEDEKGGLEWGSNGQGVFPKYRTPREGIFLEYYTAGQSGASLFIKEIGEDECPTHYDYLCSLPGVGEQLLKMKEEGIPFPTSQIDHVAFFKHGYILFITFDPAPESHDIFQRFAKAFEQTYTRFLDLKKAEEQAREAQIEAALERIRSRTMAMHSSDELQEAAILLFHEIQDLGLPTWSAGYNILSDDKSYAECWMSSEGAIQDPFILHFTGDESLKGQYEFFLGDDNFLVQEVSGQALEAHYANMKSMPKLGEMITQLEESGIDLPSHQINHLCKFEQGYLLFITYEPVPEAHSIFQRFTNVFEQTYTRFLDLQKAEE
ncbi:MAG: nuclear transport factor 2 family protein, partial [Bacteroidia bacterium]|nr:nuclear transport factor 2 family protein [Bacteroidia bacterium]